MSGKEQEMAEVMRDVFVCHAREDKSQVVRPLVNAFDRAKISYWYDEAEVGWGESITEKVNVGLRMSRYVVVVLSPAFIERQKRWPNRELFAALNEEASTGKVRILPLLVGSKQEQEQIMDQHYLLNDKMYLSWNDDAATVVWTTVVIAAPGF